MEPWFEAIWIAKRAELAPRREERGLDRVLCQVGVAQDPTCDRHASIAGHAGEGVEGLSIAALRLVDEDSLHPTLLA
jgi:hypothetical protein